MTNSKVIRQQLGLLSIAEGFFESCILFALAKVGIFELLGHGSRSSDELAAELGARPDAVARLLRGGVAARLLESTDGSVFRVAPEYAPLLVSPDGPGYLGSWLRNLSFFHQALSRLDQAVLTSQPVVDLTTDHSVSGDELRQITLAMHDYAALRGSELAGFLDISGCRTLLDLGSGPGTYAFLLAQANRDLEVTLFDLPGVLEVAGEVEQRFDVGGRVRYVPGDVRCDVIPGTYDVVLVSNLLHMLGEADSRALLERLRQSVNIRGSLVIQAQYLPDDRVGQRWPVLMDLLQLCLTSEGHNHTVAETRSWLESAGFRDIEFQPMTLLNTNSYLRAYRR